VDRLFFALGAFASHGLKSRLDPAMLATFEIGVRYQMYLYALARRVGERGGLAVRRRHRRLLRQPLPAGAKRHALARRDHAARRPRLPCRMAVPRLGGMEGVISAP
jgi:hypothetical protein